MKLLKENTRVLTLAKSRSGKGYSERNDSRFNRRNKSKIINTNVYFNKIDMNKLFKQDILEVTIPVQGETNKYLVKISFGGFLKKVQLQMRNPRILFEYKIVAKAILDCLSTEDVYYHCSCPDYKYRFDGWLFRAGNSANNNTDDPQHRLPKKTNPHNDLGAGCKHVSLVLSTSLSWQLKCANVIYNYINYIKDNNELLYKNVIYPAIYNKKYVEEIPQDSSDEEE